MTVFTRSANRMAPFISLILVVWFLVTIGTMTQTIIPLPFYAVIALTIGLITVCLYFVGSIAVEAWYMQQNISFLIGLPIETPKEAFTAGWVYLLKTSDGYYKIGHSRDPHNRRETFNVKLPFRVEYAHLIPTTNRFAAERTLHNLFRHVRTEGEWFDLSTSDVAFIKSIKKL